MAAASGDAGKIRKMGLSDVVATPGYVPGIDPWLRRADVSCAPRISRAARGCGRSLRHGVPVVSTDCSHFLHDIMTIPEAGTLVPTATRDLAKPWSM
jgi:glycosyltransferase involved in cell wall biosynthesis